MFLKNFCKFCKGWINKKDIKPVSFKQKDPFQKITLFKKKGYFWYPKSFITLSSALQAPSKASEGDFSPAKAA